MSMFDLDQVSEYVVNDLNQIIGPQWAQDERCLPDVVAYLLTQFKANTIKVKVMRLSDDAVIPVYAKQGDAGLDFTAVHAHYDIATGIHTYRTGLAVAIPFGYVGLLFPRSSLCKKDMMLTNHVGVIDSGYRGEILFKFKTTKENPDIYKMGDRIGQLIVIPFPEVQFEEVESLDETERGESGYGSSGGH